MESRVPFREISTFNQKREPASLFVKMPPPSKEQASIFFDKPRVIGNIKNQNVEPWPLRQKMQEFEEKKKQRERKESWAFNQELSLGSLPDWSLLSIEQSQKIDTNAITLSVETQSIQPLKMSFRIHITRTMDEVYERVRKWLEENDCLTSAGFEVIYRSQMIKDDPALTLTEAGLTSDSKIFIYIA